MKSKNNKKALQPYQNSKLKIEKRVSDLLGRMTLEEKIKMVSGASNMDTVANERLGIPALKMADGPHGVRWDRATCFPTGISMGASWDPELVQKFGVALAEETRGMGRNTILGPCINIHRTPQGGRNFESFSEDPHQAARIAVAYVKGVQSKKVATSTKHFACNNQEWERTTISVEIDERALREIYLPAFKAAVQEADTWTIMAAYNRFRGDYLCANQYLQNDVLKNEWGFRGLIVSDWGACHGTVDSATCGLDLEMPGPGAFFGAPLLEAVKKGEVSEEVLNDKVRRILRVIFLAGLFDGADKIKGSVDTPAHRKVARDMAAQSIVLLKNERNLLPLNKSKIRSIALIGPSYDSARLGGGGSSSVTPNHSVSTLEGLRKKLGSKVRFTHSKGGISMGDIDPIPSACLRHAGKPGLKAEYWNNMELAGEPALTRTDAQIDFNWGESSPDSRIQQDYFSARWTGTLSVPKSGKYIIGMTSDDGFRLYLDEKMIIDSWIDQAGMTRTTRMDLEEGREYPIMAEYYEKTGGAMARLGWILPGDSQEKAVELARKADVAIVCAGISYVYEGEGCDRVDLKLPGGQDELIEAVAKANPNTIVVLNNGTPVEMDSWIDQVPAILEAWYPGQEGGHALADILFGTVNPSGKLPVTFPKKLDDAPCKGNYPGTNGVVRYEEGIYVGYRYYDTKNVEPLFPFGHGLSYTQFEYSGLKIARTKGQTTVSVQVKNVGKKAGAEVVQIYVRDVKASVDRPVKELKAFKKIALKPGQKSRVQFKLADNDLAFYDVAKKSWVTEPGEFEILIGSSSRDIRLRGTFRI